MNVQRNLKTTNKRFQAARDRHAELVRRKIRREARAQFPNHCSSDDAVMQNLANGDWAHAAAALVYGQGVAGAQYGGHL